MADYHPIDVRYKGPSTAYRGSAKRNDTVKPASDRATPGKSMVQKATAGAEASPWGGAKPAQPQAPQQPRPTPAAPRPRRRGVLGGIFQNLRRAYTAFILLVIFFVFFGGPKGLMDIFSLSSGQMISMP